MITIRNLLFIVSVLWAQAVAAQTENETKTDSFNTVLFKVTSPDNKHISYLFGTHHAFGKPFFDSLTVASEALLSCRLLIKENLNIPGSLAEDIINRRTTPTKWERYLEKDEYSYARALFGGSRLDFDKMTPAELYAFLSRRYKEKVCIAKDPTANYGSLDDYVESLARENQLEVLGLETTEDQVSLINKDVEDMPRKVHRKRLSRMIARMKAGSRDLCPEVEWYRKMDIDFRMDQPCRNTLVLTDRNNKWMQQIQQHVKTESCFIAVGLSHLMFQCGLISQLKDLGYTVTPVEVK
ncbi:TraB/GumN family protein [Maribellus luteus]|uniref:TraB/GumN family protein n=1 Tax=Maribellus luteus TaxID=2305463 RepID=A0A399SUN2_9BACT|nr:TraB/GumN family protein [Maribellus luteus]RIJ47700.1 TraB/GumN family protein [Maribellus luteus]